MRCSDRGGERCTTMDGGQQSSWPKRHQRLYRPRHTASNAFDYSGTVDLASPDGPQAPQLRWFSITWLAGKRSRHFTPSGAKTRSAWPSRAVAASFLIRRRPNPSVFGGLTRGPPTSCHEICTAPPCSEATCQWILTFPSGFESAPYLPAFVASSCNAKPT